VELQKVFLASQAGQDVEQITAPKRGLGFKIFRRAFGVGRNSSKNRRQAKMTRAPSFSSLMSERSSETAGAQSKRVIQRQHERHGNGNSNGHGHSHKQKADKPQQLDSPQAFLDKELEKRGYSTKKYCSLEGGYYCRPTPYQQASYGSALSRAVRASDASTLRKMFDAGLSPNPCNNFGESLVHMICRRGDSKLLRVLLNAGCSMQVTDDYGRTPLHDACWRAETNFEAVSMILEADKHLIHLVDCRGAAPLSYVGKERYGVWIQFLRSKLDRYWPARQQTTTKTTAGPSDGQDAFDDVPPLTRQRPHTMSIADPRHALPLDVAALVANGRMKPEDTLYLDDSDDSSYGSYDSSDDEDDDDSDATYDSDEDSTSDFDETEMAEFCLRVGGPMAVAKKCFGAIERGMPVKSA